MSMPLAVLIGVEVARRVKIGKMRVVHVKTLNTTNILFGCREENEASSSFDKNASYIDGRAESSWRGGERGTIVYLFSCRAWFCVAHVGIAR